MQQEEINKCYYDFIATINEMHQQQCVNLHNRLGESQAIISNLENTLKLTDSLVFKLLTERQTQEMKITQLEQCLARFTQANGVPEISDQTLNAHLEMAIDTYIQLLVRNWVTGQINQTTPMGQLLASKVRQCLREGLLNEPGWNGLPLPVPPTMERPPAPKRRMFQADNDAIASDQPVAGPSQMSAAAASSSSSDAVEDDASAVAMVAGSNAGYNYPENVGNNGNNNDNQMD